MKRSFLLALFVTFGLILSFSPIAQAEIIFSDNFEDVTTSRPAGYYWVNQNSLTNWNLSGSNGSGVIGNGGGVNDYLSDLGGYGKFICLYPNPSYPGRADIAMTTKEALSLQAGTYALSFDLFAANQYALDSSVGSVNAMNIQILQDTLSLFDFSATAYLTKDRRITEETIVHFSQEFTLDTSMENIFLQLSTIDPSLYLDNVQLIYHEAQSPAPTPEPATLLLMGAGLLGLLGVQRFKK